MINKLSLALKPTDILKSFSSSCKGCCADTNILHGFSCVVRLSFFNRIKSVFVSIWPQMVCQVLQNIQLDSINIVKGHNKI